jgi:hypothetical protein
MSERGHAYVIIPAVDKNKNTIRYYTINLYDEKKYGHKNIGPRFILEPLINENALEIDQSNENHDARWSGMNTSANNWYPSEINIKSRMSPTFFLFHRIRHELSKNTPDIETLNGLINGMKEDIKLLRDEQYVQGKSESGRFWKLQVIPRNGLTCYLPVNLDDLGTYDGMKKSFKIAGTQNDYTNFKWVEFNLPKDFDIYYDYYWKSKTPTKNVFFIRSIDEKTKKVTIRYRLNNVTKELYGTLYSSEKT